MTPRNHRCGTPRASSAGTCRKRCQRTTLESQPEARRRSGFHRPSPRPSSMDGASPRPRSTPSTSSASQHSSATTLHDTPRGREGDVQTLSVSVQAAPLIYPVQREAFRRFFIDLAAETNSFYAEAKDEEATYGTAERQKRRPSLLGTAPITRKPVPENGWGCPSGRHGGHGSQPTTRT